MTKKTQEHIFDEFYKGDESRHDMHNYGLGMTICKKIVELHSGSIWAQSDGLNKGTTLSFTLPLRNKGKR
jgi:signal transduction histidine kinase